MENDKVAVLLATYNGEKYISEQLDSILNQTYKDITIYIHDDGSTDSTVDILEEYVRKNPGRIVIVDGKRCGSARNNFFYLMECVQESYYMFSDQDDVWLPEKIEKSMARIKKTEMEYPGKPALVFSDMRVVKHNKELISDSFTRYNNLDTEHLVLNSLIVQNCGAGCTMMFNRKTRDEALKYKMYEDASKILIHDWWVVLTAASLGKVDYIDEKLTLYRQHGSNEVGAVKEVGLKKLMQLVFWTITLSHIKETKQRIRAFVDQGKALSVFKLSGENKKIVCVMQRFDEMSKLQRIRAFRRYRIYRNKRNIWQLICL